MRHDWVFDVLQDLKSYAQANGFPALAAKADEALRIARAEMIAVSAAEAGPDPDISGSPVSGRAH